MKQVALIFIALQFMMCISCSNNSGKTVSDILSFGTSQRKLILQPFKGFSLQQSTELKKRLSAYFEHIHISNPSELPSFAYYSPRNRYRADSLLIFLNQHVKNDESIILGLTVKDISHNNSKCIDFGIFGLANCPGNAGIISNHRLSAHNREEQLFKVAIHEIGHTEGLQHCPSETCFMRDAEGKNRTDQLKDFCNDCKDKLKLKGWSF